MDQHAQLLTGPRADASEVMPPVSRALPWQRRTPCTAARAEAREERRRAEQKMESGESCDGKHRKFGDAEAAEKFQYPST